MFCHITIFKSTDNQSIWYQFSHWFHKFSIFYSNCSESAKSVKPNGSIKVLYFVWKSTILCRSWVFYDNFFGSVLQTSGVLGLITLLYAKLRYWKSISTPKKGFFSLTFHWKTGFHKYCIIFNCFSVFSSFKLIQLVCLAMEWLYVCILECT